MKHGRTSLLVFLVGLTVATAQAHHSIAGVYDSARRVSIEGRIAQFRFVYPHPVLVVDTGAEGSPAESWQLEMDNRSELAAIGVKPDTFKPGDLVTASGSPSRTEGHRLYLLKLERRADGLLYEQIGTRPQINLRVRH